MPKTRRHEVRIPHFAVPFEFTGIGSHARVTEQGRAENVEDQMLVVLGFPEGSRYIDMPEFGRPDILFDESDEDIAAKLAAAMERWIPDIDIEAEEVQEVIDEFIRHVKLTANIDVVE